MIKTGKSMILAMMLFLSCLAAASAAEFPKELHGKYSTDGNICGSLMNEFKKGQGWLGNLEISENGAQFDNGTNCVPQKIAQSGNSYKIHSQCTGEQDYAEDVTYILNKNKLVVKSTDYENKYVLCSK